MKNVMAGGSSLIAGLAALAFLAAFVCIMKWLEKKGEKQRLHMAERPAAAKESGLDHNPGGPLTDKQAQKLFEIVLQAAIRQKADTILIDAISGRPQVRLRLEGRFQELTGVGDAESFRRLVAQARRCAGLPAAAGTAQGDSGSFLRLYRRGHLVNAGWREENGEDRFAFNEISRRGRAVRFDLESIPIPGSDAVKISLRPEKPLENTRFDLGFSAAAEQKYIEAVRSHRGIVLLTGPCNSGKSTATYRALTLLRDEGRKVITVEWPIEWILPGISQYWVRDGKQWQDFDFRMDKCLRRAIRRRPDVLLVQNIDWIDDKAVQLALDYVATGGLLITAVHIQSCAHALGYVLRRHFWNRRPEAADLFRMVVAPRRLFMVCMHCAEEVRVPAKILVEAGMAEPPVAADGRVATWRGRGCPFCEQSGELGSIAVYELLDLQGEMKRFIENENDWDWNQLDYLQRQAWLHGMRTQRELALERVLAGDISLQHALLNTVKPKWLTAVQAARRTPSA
ncbi:MAG TPA: ATPase, T2SS/T4P/T4SS family [Candidatus Binatia bacterium]|nr:ATPase, T2SS/T4P/T4SS family [Candidatus Binatia bacterium]